MSQLDQHDGNSAPSATQSNGPATAGMVCGIISVATCWVPFLYLLSGLVLGIVAVVLSSKGRKRARAGAGSGNLATAGLVCGYIGIALSIANGVAGALLWS